jgi:hypothetical protein
MIHTRPPMTNVTHPLPMHLKSSCPCVRTSTRLPRWNQTRIEFDFVESNSDGLAPNGHSVRRREDLWRACEAFRDLQRPCRLCESRLDESPEFVPVSWEAIPNLHLIATSIAGMTCDATEDAKQLTSPVNRAAILSRPPDSSTQYFPRR